MTVLFGVVSREELLQRLTLCVTLSVVLFHMTSFGQNAPYAFFEREGEGYAQDDEHARLPRQHEHRLQPVRGGFAREQRIRHGDHEHVDEHGRQYAQQYAQQSPAHELADKERQPGGDERRERAEEDIHYVARDDVAQHTAYPQAGYGFREKEREHRQYFAYAELYGIRRKRRK